MGVNVDDERRGLLSSAEETAVQTCRSADNYFGVQNRFSLFRNLSFVRVLLGPALLSTPLNLASFFLSNPNNMKGHEGINS